MKAKRYTKKQMKAKRSVEDVLDDVKDQEGEEVSDDLYGYVADVSPSGTSSTMTSVPTGNSSQNQSASTVSEYNAAGSVNIPYIALGLLPLAGLI